MNSDNAAYSSAGAGWINAILNATILFLTVRLIELNERNVRNSGRTAAYLENINDILEEKL